jgi:hypothetical protein
MGTYLVGIRIGRYPEYLENSVNLARIMLFLKDQENKP